MGIKRSPLILGVMMMVTLVVSCGSSVSSIDDTPIEVPSKYRTYYELLVYSFADSNGDGIGDFKGIADKLPYLADLGINGLWLSPVQPASSYHGYDVWDYYGIRSTYEVGGYTFEDLIEDASGYDIDILMDLVLNHSGRDHNWFVTGLGAFINNVESKYKTWYNFSKTSDAKYSSGNPGGYYEAIFWDGMPDLNYDNPEVRAEMINIAKYWLAKGVAGFRLDAAMHIFTDYTVADKWNGDIYDKNIAWWQEFQAALAADYPDVYLIGEMWTGIAKIKRYYASNLDSAFNFDTKRQVTNALNGTNGFADFLEDFQQGMREYQSDGIEAYFLSNHDDGRFAALNSDVDDLKMAASLQLMAPGNGFIYYGDEIGLKGSGGTGDQLHRTPMVWGDSYVTAPANYGIGGRYGSSTYNYQNAALQQQNEDSLFTHYKRVLALKNANRELYMGTLKAVDTGTSDVVAYTVTLGSKTLLVIHNLSETQNFGVYSDDVSSLLGFVNVLEGDSSYIDGFVHMPALSTAVYELDRGVSTFTFTTSQ